MPRNSLMAAMLALTSAAAHAAYPIPDAYDVKPIAAATAPADIARCVGSTALNNNIEAFIAKALAPDAMQNDFELKVDNAGAVAVAKRGLWACIKLSKDGFPIWPLETLHGAVVAVGAAPQAVLPWRRTLLEQVAEQGIGRGLVVFGNGGAIQVNVISDPQQGMQINYNTRFLKAGEYQVGDFKAVLTDSAVTGVSTTTQGKLPGRFAIPPHRLRLNVTNEYVDIAGNDTTGAFLFADTKWKLPDGSQLWLQSDGLSVYSGKRSSDNGAWKVVNGVLQVGLASGSRYSLALSNTDNQLRGHARRSNKPSHEEDDGEWHWSVKFDKL